jgi:hypothetical protein
MDVRDPDYYLPSPAEIARVCRQIQARWTAREARKRAGANAPKRVEVQTVQTLPQDAHFFDKVVSDI